MEYPKTTGGNSISKTTSRYMQVGAQQGWQCPLCKRILSPWTAECPCKGQQWGDLTVTYGPNTTSSSADFDCSTITLHSNTKHSKKSKTKEVQ